MEPTRLTSVDRVVESGHQYLISIDGDTVSFGVSG
jgi:hypothetical protein